MNVLGIGVLFSRGRGIDALRRALIAGWQEPACVTIKDRTVPVYRVDLERIRDKTVLRKLRRSDKLSKMAVLAATDAVADSGLGEGEKRMMGVIVATAFGAHVTTFEFLDGIIDFGEAAVSPTVFSNSVHNAAASYISSSLGIQGPTITVTRFFFSFQAALQLADAWLREGRVEHVLVGAVDSFGEVMGYISGSRLRLAPDGKIRPFRLNSGAAVPGEGAAFFLLGKKDPDRAYCRISEIGIGDGPVSDNSDLDIVDADGMIPNESVYIPSPDRGTRLAAYSPVYGSMMTGSAFSVAAGALMLKGGFFFPNPASENPHGLNINIEQGDSSVDFIRCIRYNCRGEKSIIQMRRI